MVGSGSGSERDDGSCARSSTGSYSEIWLQCWQLRVRAAVLGVVAVVAVVVNCLSLRC